jgi:hypothetical protein
MASTIPPVLVELQLETANIKNQMQQLNQKFDDFGGTLKKQTSFLSNFKSAAAGVFAGNVMTQGLNLLKSGLQSAIADAQQYEKATAQLKAGIESTGNAAGLSVEGLKAHASALEELSGVDENLIIQSQAVFQTFTNIRNVAGENNDIFSQASASALDLSVKMGGDLQGATVQLGKALNDPIKGITALTRVGVVFTEAQKTQIKTLMESGDVMGAQKVILAEMNVEFGGAAKAAGDTFAGAVSRAKDKVSDLARNFITNLQPILLTIGKTLGDLYTKYLAPLVKILVDNKEALMAFTGVLLAGYVAMKAYGVIIGVVKTAQTLYAVAQVLMTGGQLASIASTNGLAASMLALNAAMRANPIGLIVTAVALLAAGFVLLWNKSETFRKIIIEVAKAVLTGVGFMIRIFGTLLETIAKVYTGPLRILLTVLSKLPGVGKYAKAGLDIINTGIGMVGDFADKTADKVEGFKSTLDGLANKKITIPGFGGKKEEAVVDPTGIVPTGGPTAEQIAAAKKNAKEKKKLLEDANKDVKSTYEKMNKIIGEARAKSVELESEYHKEVDKINKKFAEKKLAIEKSYADKELAIRKDFADKASKLEEDANIKRAGVIQKSKDLLINAFRGSTKLDLADLMKDSDQTGSSMVARLKEKYRLVSELQAKAGQLAAKGFSQTFIQDIISQGPQAGSAMADQILNSTPETIAEIKALYGKVQDVSENGMSKLADQMYEGMGFATKELADEYAQIGTDLFAALSENSKALDLALDENSKALTEALAENQKELQDSLLAAQTAYNEAIDALEKDTKDKLATLQEELKKTVQTIKELTSAKAAVAALAASPASPILAGTQSLGLADKSTVIINNNTTVNGTNLADPAAAADEVEKIARFGSTQALSSKISRYERMGIM